MPTALANHELLVVTGKGGVGKSTLAAALGLAAAADGATLLLEMDPRESVHRLLEVPPSGGEIVAAGDGLYLQSVQPRQVLDDIVAARLKIPAIASRVLASPVYRHFTEGAPGLKPLAVLWHALRLLRDPRDGRPPFRRVILDAPATGHGVSLLLAPLLVSEVVERGPVAEMTREVAAWVKSAEAVGVVVVTLAEEMPVTEALELQADLEARLGRPADAVLVNGLYPPWKGEGAPGDELGRLWKRRRKLNESELRRLKRQGRPPDLQLPLIPQAGGRGLAETLAPSVAPLLSGDRR